MQIFPRLAPAALLLTALSLAGCGDGTSDQAGQPLDLPASPEQLKMLDAVVERFPELSPAAERARADGEVTEQEIIDVLTEAERLKEAGDGE
ncbi:hypothetical protein [Thiohalocapsa sp. ML1]|uniref:hypothetical protein n=1 Tax=Thiohalocapsa sp. ML1 TaxID=1431688 RepID=UPI0007322AA4|nr:hypothetical protein [Thiohalocapsa sp. ML1]